MRIVCYWLLLCFSVFYVPHVQARIISIVLDDSMSMRKALPVLGSMYENETYRNDIHHSSKYISQFIAALSVINNAGSGKDIINFYPLSYNHHFSNKCLKPNSSIESVYTDIAVRKLIGLIQDQKACAGGTPFSPVIAITKQILNKNDENRKENHRF